MMFFLLAGCTRGNKYGEPGAPGAVGGWSMRAGVQSKGVNQMCLPLRTACEAG